MIKIERTDQPKILKTRAEAWTQKLLSANSEKERRKVESKYKHPHIKKALIFMCHGKCSYCESKITHVDYGDIEHYKPKSKFRELTFEWTNLFFACGICNGTNYKGNNFPEAGEGGPLINPCDDDPIDHFEFFYDTTVYIASVYGITMRGKVTENLLGLNRHDLRKYRSRYVQKLYVLARRAGSDPEAEALLNEAKQDEAEYAAFAKVLSPQI